MGETIDGRDFIFYINSDTFQKGTNQVFRARRTTLTLGEIINGSNDDNNLKGTPGIDTITGGQGNDSLEGKQGGDVIGGGKGDDILRGNQGEDRLNGGAGENTLEGGRGYDVFVIKNKKGNNTISDLDIEQDMIEVLTTNTPSQPKGTTAY